MTDWESRVVRVDPRAAAELMAQEGFAYVDVRTEAEFLTGHPRGAYNIPYGLPAGDGLIDNPRFVDTVRASFGPEGKVLLGCRSGNRSLRAATLLLSHGFQQLREQRCGFEGTRDAFGGVEAPGWKTLELPWSAQPMPGRSHHELLARVR